MKTNVDRLWEEFHLPLWITEFDWNRKEDVDFGDHSVHAQRLEDFYRLMFSLEVSTIFVFKVYKQMNCCSNWKFLSANFLRSNILKIFEI